MNFTVINEGFQCQNCDTEVPKQKGSCRNHCTQCLHSLHVDADFPGDRASNCHGLMAPTGITKSGKKGWMLLHSCTKCGATIRNKVADDDNQNIITELSRLPLISSSPFENSGNST